MKVHSLPISKFQFLVFVSFFPSFSSGDQVSAKCARITLHFDAVIDMPVSVKLELEFDLGAFIPPIL